MSRVTVDDVVEEPVRTAVASEQPPVTSAWFVNEFGAIPALVVSGLAVFFWIKGKKKFGNMSDWQQEDSCD